MKTLAFRKKRESLLYLLIHEVKDHPERDGIQEDSNSGFART